MFFSDAGPKYVIGLAIKDKSTFNMLCPNKEYKNIKIVALIKIILLFFYIVIRTKVIAEIKIRSSCPVNE